MGVEHLLDLARIDVVAAADDEILLAVDDEQEAVLVDVAEVAGAHPAAGEGRLGGLGIVVVALHHVDAADHHLADVVAAGRQDAILLVPDLDVHAPDRLADAVDLALRRR